MFYYFLLPNFIEKLLQMCNNIGNIALHGMFLDLYYKHNLFYISLLSLFFMPRKSAFEMLKGVKVDFL